MSNMPPSIFLRGFRKGYKYTRIYQNIPLLNIWESLLYEIDFLLLAALDGNFGPGYTTLMSMVIFFGCTTVLLTPPTHLFFLLFLSFLHFLDIAMYTGV